MLTKELKNKINSSFTKKEVYEIDYNDLEYIINAYYDMKDYEVIAFEEWSNYTSHDYCIKKQPLDEYDVKRLASFKGGGKKHYILHTLLTDLCNNDVIPEGNILIKVYW